MKNNNSPRLVPQPRALKRAEKHVSVSTAHRFARIKAKVLTSQKRKTQLDTKNRHHPEEK
jgi:hypothetical protein